MLPYSPSEVTEFYGEHWLRVKYQLCDEGGVCFSLEAQHTLYVALNFSKRATKVEIESRDTAGEGRRQAIVQ